MPRFRTRHWQGDVVGLNALLEDALVQSQGRKRREKQEAGLRMA
jgi:hypothetical protein